MRATGWLEVVGVDVTFLNEASLLGIPYMILNTNIGLDLKKTTTYYQMNK